MRAKIKAFFKKETVLCISMGCAIITMFFVAPDRQYGAYIDFRVLCLLFCLMAVVAGCKQIGVFRVLTYQMLRCIHNGRVLGAALVSLPFISSMLVTNDVALLVFVPFTITFLSELGCKKAIIPMLVLQTVAANLGSMATPVGNPQNLYLYAFYQLDAASFFSVVFPLAAISLVWLIICACCILPKTLPEHVLQQERFDSLPKLSLYAGLFVLCLLTVFRIIPYPITTGMVVLAILIADRKLICEVDALLLLTFACFFIVSGNLGRMDIIRNSLQQLLSRSPLLTAVGTSQIISNVPAAILLSTFTDLWKPLLAGVNIGGLGTPIASLASLITLKLYMRSEDAKIGRFLLVFTVVNLCGLLLLLGAFALLD